MMAVKRSSENPLKKPPLPVDRGWAWMVMVGAFVNILIVIAFVRSLSILLPVFLEHFQEPAAVTTLAFGISEVLESFSHIAIANVLLAKYSVRTLCVVGSFFHGVGIISLAFAPNIVVLNIIFGAMGLARALMLSPPLVHIGHFFKKRLSFANSCASAGLSVATVGSPIVTRLLLDAYGYQGALILFGALCLNAVAASLLLRPISDYEVPKEENKSDDQSKENQHENKALLPNEGKYEDQAGDLVKNTPRGCEKHINDLICNDDNDRYYQTKESNECDDSINEESALISQETESERLQSEPLKQTNKMETRTISVDTEHKNKINAERKLSNLTEDNDTSNSKVTTSKDTILPKEKYTSPANFKQDADLTGVTENLEDDYKVSGVSYRCTSLDSYTIPIAHDSGDDRSPNSNNCDTCSDSAPKSQRPTSVAGHMDHRDSGLYDAVASSAHNPKRTSAIIDKDNRKSLSGSELFESNDSSIFRTSRHRHASETSSLFLELNSLHASRHHIPKSSKTSQHSNTELETQDETDSGCRCGWSCLKQYITTSVLMNPYAVILMLASGIGIQTQGGNIFLPALGLENGLSHENVPWLMTIAGVSDIIGKLSLGYFADLGYVRAIHISCVTQLTVGVLFQFTPFYQGMGLMVVMSSVFGGGAGILNALLSPMIIEMVGLEYLARITAAFFLVSGVVTFVMSVGVGYIRDTTGSFAPGYNFIGGLMLLSVVIMGFEPVVKRFQKRQQEAKDESNS